MDANSSDGRPPIAANDVRSARIVKRGAVLRVLVISVTLAVVLMIVVYLMI